MVVVENVIRVPIPESTRRIRINYQTMLSPKSVRLRGFASSLAPRRPSPLAALFASNSLQTFLLCLSSFPWVYSDVHYIAAIYIQIFTLCLVRIFFQLSSCENYIIFTLHPCQRILNVKNILLLELSSRVILRLLHKHLPNNSFLACTTMNHRNPRSHISDESSPRRKMKYNQPRCIIDYRGWLFEKRRYRDQNLNPISSKHPIDRCRPLYFLYFYI